MAFLGTQAQNAEYRAGVTLDLSDHHCLFVTVAVDERATNVSDNHSHHGRNKDQRKNCELSHLSFARENCVDFYILKLCLRSKFWREFFASVHR